MKQRVANDLGKPTDHNSHPHILKALESIYIDLPREPGGFLPSLGPKDLGSTNMIPQADPERGLANDHHGQINHVS